MLDIDSAVVPYTDRLVPFAEESLKPALSHCAVLLKIPKPHQAPETWMS